MRQFAKKLHLWLSLPFGLIITTICFTGAILTLEKGITERVYRDRYVVPVSAPQPLPLEELVERVAATLPDSVQITGITIPHDSTRSYTVQLSKPRRAGVLIDPYTGQTLGRSDRSPFFMTVFRLHRWLLDSMNPQREGIFWGRLIVGTSTLLFVIILLTGLIAWLPKRLKGFSKRLKIHTRHGIPRFLHELHTIGGLYAMILLLVMALTGLTWSFEWYSKGFYKLFGVEQQEEKPGGKGDKGGRGGRGEGAPREGRGHGRGEHAPKDEAPSPLPKTYHLWQQVYAEVSQDKANHPQITLRDGRAEGSLSALGNARATDVYHFDESTGAITRVERYADAPASKGARGWVYAIHTGSWGGWLTSLLWCVAALIGGTLPLTGYYLYFRRLRQQSRHKR